MRWAVSLLGLVAGCQFTQPVGSVADNAAGDARVDVTTDASDDLMREVEWPYGELVGGGLRACVTLSGYVFCWGSHWNGALGSERDGPGLSPTMVSVGLGRVDQIAMGYRHTCVRVGGAVWCWGENDFGELGYDTHRVTPPGEDGGTDYSATPNAVPGIDDASEIVAGDHVSCARRGDGWWCWGRRVPPDASPGMPLARVSMLEGASAVAIGTGHLCGLWREGDGGRARCVGFNALGQLGDGTRVDRDEAVEVLDDDGHALTSIIELVAGRFSTCALLADRRTVRCWGELTPAGHVTIRADEELRSIGVGDSHLCVLKGSGRVSCWGDNHDGRLGDGTTQRRSELVDVRLPEGVLFAQMVVSVDHGCAMESGARRIWCWGANGQGQLGAGDQQSRTVPAQVLRPP